MDTSEAGRRLVDGRFELISPLGSGGMGTVWRARDIALDREVALKEVRPPDPALAEARPDLAVQLRQRAVREARALARLSHPHVVTIHHIVEPADGSHPWIVMEFVKGGSLYDRLVQGPMPVAEVRRLGLEVLSALRAAHAEGVQHRDVKPANVLLRANGSAVLTDFGIAALRESTSLTATGDLIGSPEYIAPERVRGEEGNPASDLWSLGMMLYVAAEGTHPLRRATSLATVVAVLDEPIPYPVRSGPLAPVLAGLLVRDPAARPDGEQLERLLQAAGGDGTAPPAAPVPGPATVPPAAATPAPGYGYPHTPGPANPYAASNPYAAHPAGGAPAPGAFVPPATTPVPYPEPVRPRRARTNALTGLLVAAALVGGTFGVVKLLPGDDGGKTGANGGDTSTSAGPNGSATHKVTDTESGGPGPAAGDASGGTDSGDEAEAPDDLLTTAGARAVVEAFRKKTGTTVFVDLKIYPEYAFASVPTKDAGVADEWEYRNGKVTNRGPGGIVKDQGNLIDMSKVKWEALPALLTRSQKELGVTKPTSRYLIVEPFVFDGTNDPSVRPYYSDAYGRGGYVYADMDCKVIRVVD
ncbi:serine/threonine protein kinase [Streptomyces bambusae]|uniref:serine/threonine-protein kinase n=1 Tax=Streptomyces bambusae TaxID=1550616 RepID=UPI001CFE629E|nr:serine/threonine-protein kinase [Streptomyces bambusae]MCB5164227.1 serine/threonine protein kinase [Streptomyces bambusae]